MPKLVKIIKKTLKNNALNVISQGHKSVNANILMVKMA